MCTYKEQSTNHQISDEMDKNYKTADTQIDFTTHRITENQFLRGFQGIFGG